MIFDLHSHTNLSDGELTPEELLLRAVDKGVDVLAVTDHDTIDAYREMPVNHEKLKLVGGIEFSTQWENTGIHILGLNIELDSESIKAGAKFQSAARLSRARVIAEKLNKHGIEDAFQGASKLAIGSYIGRPHFAQYVVSIGKAKSIQDAFKKYLGAGKTGDVKQHWAELSQIVQWIRDANGIAVLAHPLKYKLTMTKLKRFLDCFITVGGQGMEVVSGRQLAHATASMAQLCEQKGLLASCGSDFHRPSKHWAELGAFPRLPDHVTPVWEHF